jgi:hypothetical protein
MGSPPRTNRASNKGKSASSQTRTSRIFHRRWNGARPALDGDFRIPRSTSKLARITCRTEAQGCGQAFNTTADFVHVFEPDPLVLGD